MIRVAVAVLAALVSSVVFADKGDGSPSPTAEARRHFEAGANAYALAEYDRAIKEYRASYDLSPPSARPLLLFDLGQAYRKVGNYTMALHSYQQYLSLAPHGRYRSDALDQVRTLEPLVEAQRKATAAPPDGVATTEQPAPPPAPSPSPAVMPAPSVAIVSAPPPPRRPWYRNTPGMVLAGSGAAVLIVSVGLLGAAATERSAALDATTQADFEDHHNTSNRFQYVGWPLLAVGGGLAVGGAIVLAVKERRK